MEHKSHVDPVSQAGASQSLAELLAGFHRACPLAAAELVKRYRGELLRYTRWLISQRGLGATVTADDVVQDTWLQVFKSLMRPRTFPDEPAFVAFLHRIVEGRINRYCRASKAAKRSAHGEEPLDMARHDQPAAEPDPVEVAAFADELKHALAAFPPECEALVEALRGSARLGDAVAAAGISRAHRAALA